eukprot:g7392.t1
MADGPLDFWAGGNGSTELLLVSSEDQRQPTTDAGGPFERAFAHELRELRQHNEWGTMLLGSDTRSASTDRGQRAEVAPLQEEELLVDIEDVLRAVHARGAFGYSLGLAYGLRAVLPRASLRGLRPGARCLLALSDCAWLLTSTVLLLGSLNGVVPASGQKFAGGNTIFLAITLIFVANDIFALFSLPGVLSTARRLHAVAGRRTAAQLQRTRQHWCALGWLLALGCGLPIFLLGFQVRSMDPWFIERLAPRGLGTAAYVLSCAVFFPRYALLCALWCFTCQQWVPVLAREVRRVTSEHSSALEQTPPQLPTSLECSEVVAVFECMAQSSAVWSFNHVARIVTDLIVVSTVCELMVQKLFGASAGPSAHAQNVFLAQAFLNGVLNVVSVAYTIVVPAHVNAKVIRGTTDAYGLTVARIGRRAGISSLCAANGSSRPVMGPTAHQRNRAAHAEGKQLTAEQMVANLAAEVAQQTSTLLVQELRAQLQQLITHMDNMKLRLAGMPLSRHAVST